MLLDAGADINAMVSPCCTDSALLAFTTEHISHYLFSFFFFLNQDVKSGQTPLIHAVENNNTDMVHFLIEVIKFYGQG